MNQGVEWDKVDKSLTQSRKVVEESRQLTRKNLEKQARLEQKFTDLMIRRHDFPRNLSEVQGDIHSGHKIISELKKELVYKNTRISYLEDTVETLRSENKELVEETKTLNQKLKDLIENPQKQHTQKEIDYRIYVRDLEEKYFKQLKLNEELCQLLQSNKENTQKPKSKKKLKSSSKLNSSKKRLTPKRSSARN